MKARRIPIFFALLLLLAGGAPSASAAPIAEGPEKLSDYQLQVYQHELEKIRHELEAALKEQRNYSSKELQKLRSQLQDLKKEIENSIKAELSTIAEENAEMRKFIAQYKIEVIDLREKIAKFVAEDRELNQVDIKAQTEVVKNTRSDEEARRKSTDVELRQKNAALEKSFIVGKVAEKKAESVARALELLGDAEKTEKVLMPDPEGAKKLKIYADQLYAYSQEIKNFKEALRDNLDKPDKPLKDLGAAYLESERYFNTIDPKGKSEVIKDAKKSQDAFGGYEAALLALKLILSRNPDDAETTYLIAKIYSEMNDGVNAVNYYRRAKALYEKNGDAEKLAQVTAELQTLTERYKFAGSVAGCAADKIKTC